MEKRPTDEQLAKYRKNAQDQSLSAEVRAKFKAVVDKFDNVAEKIGEDVVKVAEPKKTRGRKPASTSKPKTKQTGTDIEKAKAEIKAKTGKTEEECESIIEQYRALRTKAQEGKRKAEQASADNKKRVDKLDKKGDIIEGTNEKTADAVIESTAEDVVEKIEKEVKAVEAKAEKEAKAEVAKDKTITTPKEKKEAVEAKVEKKVAEKTKTIVKRVVIDTSALLTSIAESLGKFDKDSQKEFLIKLRSDIDKLLSKYAFGGLTDGGVQVMNIQQSNLSASSVNPTLFAGGGGVGRYSKIDLLVKKPYGNEEMEIAKFKGTGDAIISASALNENSPSNYEYSVRNSKKYANGGVVGQEIVFDDNGDENTGVIKEIHDTTGDYIVNTDDGRTILVQLDRDVISLGGMRKAVPMEVKKKRFGFFAGGGGVDGRQKDVYNKLVASTDDEFYFVDYIFNHNDGFKGATGTIVMPVSKSYYDNATSYDGILESYMDSMGEDEWLDVLGLDRDDFEDESEMMEAIENGIYQLYTIGELNPFEEVNYELEEQMRNLPQFSDEDEYPVFEVIGGGRIFDKERYFDKIYDKKLYDKIRKVEEFRKGGGVNSMMRNRRGM
jgi:hypothetical protein